MANFNLGAAMVSSQLSSSLSQQINGGNLVLQSAGLNAASPNWVSLDPLHSISWRVKKYEMYESAEDILVLSVVWQRLRKEMAAEPSGSKLQFNPPTTLLDNVLFDKITPADAFRAETIRDYYSKKLMMWSLNDTGLTNFRKDMRTLVMSDGKQFKENMLPLTYRLPEFYDYDTQIDELMLAHNTTVKHDTTARKMTKRLQHVKTLRYSRKSTKWVEFWFRDENENLNYIKIRHDNPLLSLMEFAVKSPLRVEGSFILVKRDNREFCVIDKYSFLEA